MTLHTTEKRERAGSNIYSLEGDFCDGCMGYGDCEEEEI